MGDSRQGELKLAVVARALGVERHTVRAWLENDILTGLSLADVVDFARRQGRKCAFADLRDYAAQRVLEMTG